MAALPPLGAGLNWYTGTLQWNGTIMVNRAPVATPITLTNYPPAVLEIPFETLLATTFDDNSYRVAGLDLRTTNGVTTSLVYDAFHDELAAALRAFMDWIYLQLNDENDWLMSDENVDEYLADETFDEDGNVL